MGFLSTTNHTPTPNIPPHYPELKAIYTSIPMCRRNQPVRQPRYAAFVAADIFKFTFHLPTQSLMMIYRGWMWRDSDALARRILCSFTISFLGPPTPSFDLSLDKRETSITYVLMPQRIVYHFAHRELFFPDEQFTHLGTSCIHEWRLEIFTVRVGTSPDILLLSTQIPHLANAGQTRLL